MARHTQRAVALVDQLIGALQEYERRTNRERRPGLRKAVRDLKGIRHEIRSPCRRRGKRSWPLLHQALRIVTEALLEDV